MRSEAKGRRRPASAALVAAALAAGGIAAAAPAAAQTPMLPDTLDITRAVQVAIRESPVLRISQTQADQAGADQLAAWGAFLPRAGVNLSLGRSNSTVSTYEAEEGPTERLAERLTYTSQSANQGLSLSLALLEGGRRFAALRETKARARAAQRRYDDQTRGLILTVRREFLEALRRQELLELTRAQIADRELVLEVARRRYMIAAVDRTDVLAAEGNLLTAQISLNSEENQLHSGLRQLVVSMGLPPEAGDGLVLTGDEGMPEQIPDVEAIVRAAVTSDPELAALEAERSAASAALWSLRTTYLPTINASMSWGRGENFGPGTSFWQFGPGDTSHRFSISASWNIFDGFRREQQNAVASIAKRRAQEELRRRRIEIERDVRRYGSEIELLAQTLGLVERAFAISQERLGMEQERYRAGTGSFLELQNAINAAQNAESSLIQRRYDYLIAWSNLAEYVDGRP